MSKMEGAQLKRKIELKEDEENSHNIGISAVNHFNERFVNQSPDGQPPWIYLKRRQMMNTLRQYP